MATQEVSRLAYFLQAAGEALGFRFAKRPDGPYVENVREVLRGMEDLISDHAHADGPFEGLMPVPGVVPEAEALLEQHPATRERFERVVRLVDGFETPFGLELLATVHWVAAEEGAKDDESILKATYAWGERKRRFTPGQVKLAADRLGSAGWL